MLSVCQNVRFQFVIDCFRFRRTSHNTGVKVPGAASDAQFPGLSLHSLAYGDSVVKLVEQAFLPKEVQCMDEISVAGAAGVHFLDSIGYLQNAVPAGKLFLLALPVQANDLRL
jgi:hypothetical protein